MSVAKDYNSVMGRSAEIMKESLGLDFDKFESGSVAFDYEELMKATGYTIEEICRIQSLTGVGNTPLLELRNITKLARKYAKPGYGAQILAKDEAANPSGSFKDRRAACAVAHAKKLGYKGVIAATSGNYGAAVASQAAMQGMKCIIVQECYDSHGVGQPEIVEKARKCEALGAEVIQLTVGPELFYEHLSVLEDTGYFNASLYSPFGIAGVETLGYEIAEQCREKYGKSAGELKSQLEVSGPKLILSNYYNDVFKMEDRAIERLEDLYNYWMPYVKDTTTYPIDWVFTPEELEVIDMYRVDFENAVSEQEALWLRDGAPTDDEWNAYLQTLERCGMSELLEVYQAAYDRYAEAK